MEPTRDLPAALLRAEAWPHPCRDLRMIETHLSWVFLTGDHAYKVKKPVDTGFADFTTLERRERFCREELRCNRAFAPDLYLDVVPIVDTGRGGLSVDPAAPGPVVDWAVRMRQFPSGQELDQQVEAGAIDAATMRAFGVRLAEQHDALPRWRDAFDVEARVRRPVLDNFTTLAEGGVACGRLTALRDEEERAYARIESLLDERAKAGFVRECHGDLHLSNLIRTESGVVAFDCIEFDPALRWIDVASDLAFLMMDCAVRGRRDLAYAFVDGYFDRSGDYGAARLIPYFRAYRSLVRAKVAGLQIPGAGGARKRSLEARRETHVRYAEGHLSRATGSLWITCGLSGSGKSWLAERLAPELAAIRLRSDVARRTAGGGAVASAERYSDAARRDVYERLACAAEGLLCAGEDVIVDATFLARATRRRFEALAHSVGAPFAILWCDAPESLLRERIRARAAEGKDASEADLEVLQAQIEGFAPPGGDERVERFDTAQPVDASELAARLRTDRS